MHGYKHAMVQIFAISVATSTRVVIMDAPIVDDTRLLCEIVNYCGGDAKIIDHKVVIDPANMSYRDIDTSLTSKIHGSMYLISAFAIRFGKLALFETGGCQIGDKNSKGKRPTSQITDILKFFGGGFDCERNEGVFDKEKNIGKCLTLDIMDFSEDKKSLVGPKISGATKIGILYALTTQKTIIKNAYVKTDVMDMLRFIKSIGYNTQIKGRDIIILKKETAKNEGIIEFYLTSCPSEVITYITLSVITNLKLTLIVENIEQLKETLKLEFQYLKEIGVNFSIKDNSIIIEHTKYPLKNTNIIVDNETIQSDHHPFFTLMLLKSDAVSNIKEYVWRNRFLYAEELKKIGANIDIDSNSINIHPSTLISKNNVVLNCSDTRAGAILLLAALSSENSEIAIENLHHIERGYEGLMENLIKLGANINVIGE